MVVRSHKKLLPLHGKVGYNTRRKRLLAAKDAERAIILLFQHQNFDSTRFGINDPVFRDAETRIGVLLLAPVKACPSKDGEPRES
jgi:hypothetical protein